MNPVEARSTKYFEMMRATVESGAFVPPIASLIGMTVTRIEPSTCTVEMDTDPARHANPMGTLHGGVICDLADLAMGGAFATTLLDGESFTTLDLTTKFFKPIWKSHLKATATVTKRNQSIGFVECEVTDEKGSLVAKVFSTCTVLRGSAASGR